MPTLEYLAHTLEDRSFSVEEDALDAVEHHEIIASIHELLEEGVWGTKVESVMELSASDLSHMSDLERHIVHRNLLPKTPHSTCTELGRMFRLDAMSVRDKKAELMKRLGTKMVKKEIAIPLSERDRYILENRFLSSNPQKLTDIGDHLGVSDTRAGQIAERLLEKLGVYLEARGFHNAS